MDAIDALRGRFLERCQSQLPILRNGDHPEFHRTVHGLAGGAGIFGYDEISRLARIVDEALSDGRPADQAMDELIGAVEQAVASI